MDLSKIGEPEIELLNEISNSLKNACKNLIKKNVDKFVHIFERLGSEFDDLVESDYIESEDDATLEIKPEEDAPESEYANESEDEDAPESEDEDASEIEDEKTPESEKDNNSDGAEVIEDDVGESDSESEMEESTNKQIESQHFIIDNKSIITMDLNYGQFLLFIVYVYSNELRD